MRVQESGGYQSVTTNFVEVYGKIVSNVDHLWLQCRLVYGMGGIASA